MNRVLACDVGFLHMAWIVIDDDQPIACDCIHTDKVKRGEHESVAAYNARRCAIIAVALSEVRRWAQPAQIVLETPTGGSQNASSARCMAMATAIAATVFRNHECHWMKPERTKDAAKAACLVAWPDFAWPKLERDAQHIFDSGSCYLLFRKWELQGCPLPESKPRKKRKTCKKKVPNGIV